MVEYEATFEIASRSDAYAVERLLERAYDTMREELRTAGGGAGESSERLAAFEAVRAAARDRSPGRLRIVYETRAGGFDE